ncbi:MAG: valine--tRNA ligase [Solirubrobacteraceae bacterium]|nr:MAG: valine--tRNA ligase [Solirubrobacterales bacterium]
MSTDDLARRTRYEPAEAEPRIIQRWLESGINHPRPEGTAAANYSIAIPPPNVTGSLHIGHAFQDAIMDTLIRHHRLHGQRARWIFGTDHAGIATQTQVERLLRAEGTSREEIGREAFVERVWAWREQYGSEIIGQLERLGASCDFDDERFTLDEGYVRAVMRVFVELYRDGLIYRDRYLVNWDPGSRSAISDLEVVEQRVTDTLYSIAYPLTDGREIIVATVRPETMLADTAVAVNPADDRYRDMVGGVAILPLVGRELPIIADDYVRPDFGTGALKITPGHDANDFEIGRRHELAELTVIGEDGCMSAAAGEQFAGLSVLEAREAVVKALHEGGLIRARVPYSHDVPFSHRSGERIEPLISLQWFMRMDELARPAIDAVSSGRVRIKPEGSRRVYLEWMTAIRPWCISRQLWWGHQIPVWYRGEEVHVGEEAPAGDSWERDPDVLDTWFSSALWPFATLGWPEQTPELSAFYPTDVLVTARDILFLWVARMVMMGLRFTGDVPFSDVYVHSVIQAPDGRRMSKSLGTGIDPLDLIEGGPRPPVFSQGGEFPAYGADAVRFGLLAMSSTQDVRFSEEKVRQGEALTNKLFNAARLVLLRVDPDAEASPRPEAIEDRWILSRLERTKAHQADSIGSYEFAKAALGLYDFVYAELCDWYLEWVKPRLAAAGNGAVSSTLLHVLLETLALAHPIIPFVTEEIYSLAPSTDGLLAASRAPDGASGLIDEAAETQVQRAIVAVTALRKWREGVGAGRRELLSARLEAAGYEETASGIAALGGMRWSEDGCEPADRVPIPGGAVAVLDASGLDLEAPARRRQHEGARLEAEIKRAEDKLANTGFVGKAPPELVDAEREKLRLLRAELEEL